MRLKSQKILLRALLIVAVFAIGAAIARADTIRLKDGSIIKGKVVDFKNGQFTVVLNGAVNRRNQISLYFEDVESIEFDDATATATATATPPPRVVIAPTPTPTPTASLPPTTSVVITPSRPPATNNGNTNNGSVSNGNNTASPPLINGSGDNSSNNSSEPVTATNPPPVNNTVAVNPNVRITNANQSHGNNNGSLAQVINAQPTNSTTNTPVSGSNGGGANPVFLPRINVKVLADNTSNGWTNTGLVVRKGQRLRISATGRVSLGAGKYSTPAGVGAIADSERLMKTEPTGALIAVIGDDNNEFVFVGNNREFTAQRDGTLFLGINEGDLSDNSGAFETAVEAEAVTP